jgi:hypothetical protein
MGLTSDRRRRTSRGHSGRNSCTVGLSKRPSVPEWRNSGAMWWATRDSNPDELPHTPLKRARLPVPPAAQLSRLILAKGKCAGTRGKTRTRNLLIRSQALYPLSYAGGLPMVWNPVLDGARVRLGQRRPERTAGGSIPRPRSASNRRLDTAGAPRASHRSRWLSAAPRLSFQRIR